MTKSVGWRGFLIAAGMAAVLPATVATLPAGASARSPHPSSAPCVVYSNPSMVAMGAGTQQWSIADIIRVGCEPEYSGSSVTIDATQLSARCQGKLSWSRPYPTTFVSGAEFKMTLDVEGNAIAVVWGGPSCASGTNLISATIDAPPYSSAQATFTIRTPQATPAGAATNPRAEVEDATYFSIATVIEVEFPVADAGKVVTINAAGLFTACRTNLKWVGPGRVVLGSGVNQVNVTLDNFGNAFVVVTGGSSCASGSSTITAVLTTPPNTSHSTTFNVLLPRPTH